MSRQKLTPRQRRVVRLVRKCGVAGFVDAASSVEKKWEPAMLSQFPEEWLDSFEEYLRDFEALQQSLRSNN